MEKHHFCSRKINKKILKPIEIYTKIVYNISRTKINVKKEIQMAKFVYADNAATTPVAPEVIREMIPVFESSWGNPSSLHAKGREAKALLDSARERIAKVLNCNASELGAQLLTAA